MMMLVVLVLLLLLASSAMAAADCSTLVCNTTLAALQTFADCGAAVLQFGDEGIYGESLAISNVVTVVEMLLHTSHFTNVLPAPAASALFSPVPSVLFPAQLAFPAFEVLAMETEDSLDADFCLNASPSSSNLSSPPCPPRHFRHVELESGDLVFIDPYRTAIRLCDSSLQQHDDAPLKPCAFASKQKEVLFRFRSNSFELPKSQQEPHPPLIVGSEVLDQDRLFELWGDVQRARQQHQRAARKLKLIGEDEEVS